MLLRTWDRDHEASNEISPPTIDEGTLPKKGRAALDGKGRGTT